MSSINLSQTNPAAIPAPNNGEVEFFADLDGDPSLKLPSGQIKTLGAVFGSEFTSKKRTATQTTNSSAFSTYDTLNLTGLPAGNYRVDMRWVWGYASGSNDIRVRWVIDGVDLIPEQRQEPKDGGSNQRHHESSFEVLALEGNHSIEVQFASSNGSSQARMYQSQIIVYRID